MLCFFLQCATWRTPTWTASTWPPKPASPPRWIAIGSAWPANSAASGRGTATPTSVTSRETMLAVKWGLLGSLRGLGSVHWSHWHVSQRYMNIKRTSWKSFGKCSGRDLWGSLLGTLKCMSSFPFLSRNQTLSHRDETNLNIWPWPWPFPDCVQLDQGVTGTLIRTLYTNNQVDCHQWCQMDPTCSHWKAVDTTGNANINYGALKVSHHLCHLYSSGNFVSEMGTVAAERDCVPIDNPKTEGK